MEHQSHSLRELRVADPSWSVPELMARLAKALVSDGPALSLTETNVESVNSRIALVVTTTGSSGIAKEVGLTASALISSARASHKYIGAEFGETWSLLLPLNHIAGINVLIRSLELGTVPVDLRNTTGELPKVDYTAIVPTQLYKALHGNRELLDHLINAKAVLVGGAALSAELRAQAQAVGIKVIETYGSTETCGGCVYDGKPLDGVEIDCTGNKISIRGTTLAHSYLNSQMQLIEDGWYRTSDLGHFDHGKLIIDGRVDDVVLSGGVNISIEAVARILAEKYPSIETAVTAIEDEKWGNIICAFFVASPDAIDEVEVQSHLDGETFIKKFIYCDSLPVQGIGKVNRAELYRLAKES